MTETDELHRMLDERGVKWWKASPCKTKWHSPVLGGPVAVRELNGKMVLDAGYVNVTPEQAVAATLGRPIAKSHPYGYERDTGAYDCTRCECGCINDISATYCNDCGGEIEIDESAEKEYYDDCVKHNTVFAVKHDDGSLEFCERRYIPEDAVTLGGRMLTADDVRDAIERYSDASGGNGRDLHSWAYTAIADELNATLCREESYTRDDVESAFVSGYSLGCLPVGSDPQWDQNEQTVDEHMAELGWVRAELLPDMRARVVE